MTTIQGQGSAEKEISTVEDVQGLSILNHKIYSKSGFISAQILPTREIRIINEVTRQEIRRIAPVGNQIFNIYFDNNSFVVEYPESRTKFIYDAKTFNFQFTVQAPDLSAITAPTCYSLFLR